jgi:hypothetical protein
MRKALSIALALATSPLIADEGETLRIKMQDDLTGIKAAIASRYAPLEFKEEFYGWDLQTEYELACRRIHQLEQPSTKQFQVIVKDFLRSMRDYHIQVAFWATEQAHLPFTVDTAEGRFFICDIDRSKLPESSFPFQVGDELLYFDDRPVEQVVDQIRERMASGYRGTDLAMAAIFLTHRNAMLMPGEGVIPRGPVMLAIQPKGLDKVLWTQLAWEYTPEEINQDTPRVRGPLKSWGRKHLTPAGLTISDKLMVGTLSMTACRAEEFNPADYRKTRLPEMGQVIWRYTPVVEGELDFSAYIYRSPTGRQIGFVRIPDYMGSSVDVATFGKIISQMELQADALVIDQLDNPGGSVFYLYGLAGHLSPQPLETPRHIMTITQQDVLESKEVMALLQTIETDEMARTLLGDDIGGYPVSYTLVQMLLEDARFTVDEWNAGRWKTHPYYIMGVDRIHPAPQGVFTKPILVLTNERDFSGGDFFPAILQDNKRALIVGTRTAGAGGYVLGNMYPNIFGVAMYTFTGSLAIRPNQETIESRGVTPDVQLPISANDLQNNFKDYVTAVNALVEQQLQFQNGL